MAHSCPNCSHTLEGFTTEDKVRERLKAKSDEIKELRDGLKSSRESASSSEAYLRERDEARSELSEFREKATRSSALRVVGVDTSSESGEKAERSFLALYRSEVAGLEDVEKPSFEDWLQAENGARANPLLDRFFVNGDAGPAGDVGSEGGETGRATMTSGVGAKKGLFAQERGTGAAPAGARRQLSAGELRAHLQNMTPKAAGEWIKENGKDYGAGSPPRTV